MAEARAAGGRPTKLTPEVQRRICDSLRAGNYLETAASYGQVSRTVFFDWLKRGRASKAGIYRNFANAVEEAVAYAETRDVALIAKAASRTWQAAAWRLERRFPTRWSQRTHTRIEVDRALENALNRLEGRLDPATYAVVLDAIASPDDGAGAPGRPESEDD